MLLDLSDLFDPYCSMRSHGKTGRSTWCFVIRRDLFLKLWFGESVFAFGLLVKRFGVCHPKRRWRIKKHLVDPSTKKQTDMVGDALQAAQKRLWCVIGYMDSTFCNTDR